MLFFSFYFSVSWLSSTIRMLCCSLFNKKKSMKVFKWSEIHTAPIPGGYQGVPGSSLWVSWASENEWTQGTPRVHPCSSAEWLLLQSWGCPGLPPWAPGQITHRMPSWRGACLGFLAFVTPSKSAEASGLIAGRKVSVSQCKQPKAAGETSPQRPNPRQLIRRCSSEMTPYSGTYWHFKNECCYGFFFQIKQGRIRS